MAFEVTAALIHSFPLTCAFIVSFYVERELSRILFFYYIYSPSLKPVSIGNVKSRNNQDFNSESLITLPTRFATHQSENIQLKALLSS